jgi:uncharacterized cupredoxin-like copper-binding protein
MKIFALAALALAGAAVAGILAHAGSSTSSKTTTINVTEKDYSITLSSHKASVGTVHFVIKNKGKHSHGLDVSGPGVKKAKLKALVKPGKSTTLTVTVKAGKYTLWCPVPGHAALGMKTTLTAGSGGPTAPPPMTTTDPTTTGGGEAWG